MKLRIIGIIPARLGSTRLPEKVMRMIQGKPMIQHVWKRVKQAKKLDDVIVACDDPRIRTAIESVGGKAVMTRTDHPNGTSRIAEVAEKIEADVFINIQGDEPLIRPEVIDQLASVFEREEALQAATLAVKKTDPAEFADANTVKVVCGEKGDALYFSRSPIPYYREGRGKDFFYLKHIGIYAYRKSFLLRFSRQERSFLEDTEKLEQLRILEKGGTLRVLTTDYDSTSVDTEQDLKKVEALLDKISA